MRLVYPPSSSLCILIVVFVAIIGAPEHASAHGEAGLTLTATSTTEDMLPYIIDVDYSDTAIEAQRIGRFDFNLFTDGMRTRPVEFTDMWIRILRQDGSRVGKLLYAGPVAKQFFGGDGFSFLFPEGGVYTLAIRYNDSNSGALGKTVAEATFTLDVLRSEKENSFNPASTEFWVGLIGGLFLTLLGLLPMLLGRMKSAG